MKAIYHILIVALVGMFASCSNDVPVQEQDRGEGRFMLSVLTSDVTTEDISRAATFSFNTDTFKVSVADAKGLALVYKKKLNQLTDVDRTLPVAEDYLVEVESCSSEEAIAANQQWGMARFYAQDTFDIVKDETTALDMVCTMANAGLKIIFHNSFTQKFTTYAATTQDIRGLVFKGDASRVAYYNFNDATGSVSVRFTGACEGWWADRIDKTKEIRLTKGKITNLTVRYNDGTTGEAGITFETDFAMTETNDDVTVQ